MQFNPLDYPLIYMQPDYLNDASAWMQHIPFAFFLMELARPRLFVELGTHSGVSYCAFCQGAAKLQLGARCYAIDQWHGDANTGPYPEQVLQTLRAYHDPRYGTFSELVQSTFDGAVGRFADGSIDLLHIDGLHTFEGVNHDFETWRPKLSKTGIVLFHDTAVTKEGFGVFRLWAELEKQFPSFEFKHGYGLGMLGVGEEVPTKVLEFIKEAKENREAVGGLFAALGNHCKMQCVFMLVDRQQQIMNQLKRQMGITVDPRWENFRSAKLDPVVYARKVTMELHGLANETLRMHLRPGPEAKESGE